MLRIVKTDIFLSDADVLVCPVNTMGVMGAGLARDFKEIFPGLLKRYKYYCDKGVIRIGNCVLINNLLNHSVLLFPTKRHWKDNSEIGFIWAGLWHFDYYIRQCGGHIFSWSFPMLGSGLGGLDWHEVHPAMHRVLQPLATEYDIDITIHIYEDNK